MDGVVVAAALASAVLHAAWNAAVKASPDPRGAMAAQVVAAGLIALPLLAFAPLPSLAALPWLAASVLFNLLALLAMLQGYARGGGFGLVYPLARASSPVLVAVLAMILVGEVPDAAGLTGIALVSAGVALFAAGDGRRHPAALVWAVAAGAFSAGYAVCDAQGARLSPSAGGYGLAVSVLNAAVFGLLHRLRTGQSLSAALGANAPVATAGAVAAIASYLLILWVWSRAPIAVGAALRDTSVVFGALIAAAVLREPLTRRQAVAVGFVGFGAGVLRFA